MLLDSPSNKILKKLSNNFPIWKNLATNHLYEFDCKSWDNQTHTCLYNCSLYCYSTETWSWDRWQWTLKGSQRSAYCTRNNHILNTQALTILSASHNHTNATQQLSNSFNTYNLHFLKKWKQSYCIQNWKINGFWLPIIWKNVNIF